MKFKVGDKIKVTAGKDKGRDGEIEKIFPSESKVLVPGLNIYKKHVKGAQGQKGGIYEIPRAFDVAKVAIICPKCKKVTRVGFRRIESEKIRVCKKCNKEIDSK